MLERWTSVGHRHLFKKEDTSCYDYDTTYDLSDDEPGPHDSNQNACDSNRWNSAWLLTITVNTLVDEQDGSLTDGDISLRDALAAGESNETINFDAGLDGGKILLKLGELPIKSALTVDARSLPKGLTIDAGKLSRIFNIDDGDNNTMLEVALNGLTLINGDARNVGGAILSRENLSVSSCTISGNSASDSGLPFPARGGGIFAHTVTVTSSTISRNGVRGVGGRNSGGGIYATNATVSFSTISENVADGDGRGGGIYATNATVSFSTISGNSASGIANGGGIFAGTATVTSSTISGNSVFGFFVEGGGIFASTVTVISSTISDNSASNPRPDFSRDTGGGIQAADFTVKNSIVAGNSAREDPEMSPGTGASSVRFSLIGNNRGDPRLGPLADHGGPTWTHALLPGSPAIDAGDPAAVAGVGDVPAFDQRGVPFARVAGGRIDMGAFESQTAGDLDSDGDVDRDDIDRLCSAIRSGGPLSSYDLDGSGALDLDDTKILVKNVLRTSFGDSNVDRVFNSTDLTQVFQAGEYEDAIVGNSTWGDGDWNCDGEFTTADLVVAFQDGGYSAAAEAKPGSLAIDSRSLAARSLGAEDQRAKPRRSQGSFPLW